MSYIINIPGNICNFIDFGQMCKLSPITKMCTSNWYPLLMVVVEVDRERHGEDPSVEK